jgi:hypothetical protein
MSYIYKKTTSVNSRATNVADVGGDKMFRVYLVNFGWYLSEESTTLEGAVQIAKSHSFEAGIDDPDGNRVAGWNPIYGLRKY